MPLIASPDATVSIGANSTSGTITGDLSAYNVQPGMEIFVGSRNGRNGPGRVLTSYTPNGSTGASFGLGEVMSGSAITNQPFVIDNFAAPISIAAQNNLSLTLLVNGLRRFFGLSTTLDQASKTFQRDRAAGSSTFFSDIWSLAARNWFGLEHRTVSSIERLLLRTYVDGTTASESIDIDGSTGGVKTLAAEGTIASAATCDLSAPRTARVLVTGTTTITSLGGAKWQAIMIRFAGVLTLRHNATSLILPGGADIVTAAGDTAVCVSDGSGNWRILAYQRASGKALTASGATEIAGATATGRALLTARSAGLARSLLSVRQARANRLLSAYVASAPWTARTSAADNDWYSVCWSAELGLFCAVANTGTGNRVMTSPDGIAWTAQTSAADNDWRSVCWSAELGLFCAVGATGTGNRVMTSPDGIAWTARTSAVDNSWVSVCWSADLGLFCAVGATGTGNRVMTSPDGIAWTARTSAADNGWYGVCWSAELGLFCAVGATGTGNRVMTSPDGIAWTARTSAVDNSWVSVCWSADLGLFCAVGATGTGNRVMTSPDGIAWTARTSAADNGWASVCWSADLGLFCAVGATGTGNRVMTSPDGIAWTARTSAADNEWYGVCWSAELGLFCAVANTGTGNRVMTSPDGIAWTARTSAADNGWRSVCWSAELGLFCAVGVSGTGNRVMTSPDGIAWTARTSAADNGWRSVCWSAELGLFCAVANTGTGNRAMASSSGHLYWPAHPSVSASVSAAGTTQATARALTSAVSIVTTVASGAGVVLAPPDPGSRQEVLNRGANALLVYPPSGAKIESAAANAAVSLAAGGRAIFLCASATQFYQA